MVSREETPTLSDSGTNINVISRSTRDMLVSQGFQYYKRRNMERKQYIKFGKEGAREKF